jgi:N-acetylglucosaminyldiphosphoundecaprenol N-acetyl-beta-D-mannosaminyltransferase
MTAAVPKSSVWGTDAAAIERHRAPTPKVEAPVAAAAVPDDLAREVYCLLGMPIDAIEMAEVVERLRNALRRPVPFVLSTPNLNFLVATQSDPAFRDSLLLSDLCPADGMPIVWVARLIGLPIRKRIPGSDIFDALKANGTKTNGATARVPVRPRAEAPSEPLGVFLFGGAEGVAAAAGAALNASGGDLACVGTLYPGYGTVEELSHDEIIAAINASNASFLVASLGAQKGQAWLLRNHDRLRTPIRAHLGAVLNFEAGTVKRAPPRLRELGLEWLWRIKEEPQLWRRYFHDAKFALRVVLTRVLPLLWFTRAMRQRCQWANLYIEESWGADRVTLTLTGVASQRQASEAIPHFRKALASGKDIALNLAEVDFIDQRFLGLLLMLRKALKKAGAELHITGISAPLNRLFRLNGGEVLLTRASSA